MRLKCLKLGNRLLFTENPLCPRPMFRTGHLSNMQPIDRLKSAVGPFGLDHPLITVTQY